MKLTEFDEKEMAALAGQVIVSGQINDLDSMASSFNASVRPRGLGIGPEDYWRSFKKEIALVVCGPRENEADPYGDLRGVIGQHGTRSQTAIVSTIAVFVGAKMGIEAGMLVPWVALLLMFARRVGTQTFCSILRSDA